jgi:hypothetical protein
MSRQVPNYNYLYKKYKKKYQTLKDKLRPLKKCFLCEEPFLNEIDILDCGHFFHQICIKEYLDLENRCPLCQEQEKQTTDHNINSNENDEEDYIDEQVKVIASKYIPTILTDDEWDEFILSVVDLQRQFQDDLKKETLKKSQIKERREIQRAEKFDKDTLFWREKFERDKDNLHKPISGEEAIHLFAYGFLEEKRKYKQAKEKKAKQAEEKAKQVEEQAKQVEEQAKQVEEKKAKQAEENWKLRLREARKRYQVEDVDDYASKPKKKK